VLFPTVGECWVRMKVFTCLNPKIDEIIVLGLLREIDLGSYGLLYLAGKEVQGY